MTAALTALAAFDSSHEEIPNQNAAQGIEPPSSPHVGEEPVIEEIRAPEGHTMIVTKYATDTYRIAIDEQAGIQALRQLTSAK